MAISQFGKRKSQKMATFGSFFSGHVRLQKRESLCRLFVFSAGGPSLAGYVDSPHCHNRPLEVQALLDELSKFLLSLVLRFVEKQRIANVVHVLHASQLRDTCRPHLDGEEKSNERAGCRWICYFSEEKSKRSFVASTTHEREQVDNQLLVPPQTEKGSAAKILVVGKRF